MLNPVRLGVLREVVAQGSFSAAADALSYSQSAVSQAIATLEGEVGAELVERDRGGVRPTAAGAALVAHADGILARMEAAEDEVAAIAGGHGGRLRIASFPTAGATLLPLAIASFRTAHPGVELTLAEGEPEEIAPRLRAGEFDLALLFEFEGVGERLGAGLRRFELIEDPLHLALPATNLALFNLSLVIRLARAGTREALAQDYVRFARAKGLSEGRIVGVHVLRNVLVPIVTVIGVEIGSVIAFAVVTESIFSWPGMGKLLIDSINVLDRPVIVGYLCIVVVLFVAINLLVDLLYSWIDPRAREASA